MADVTLFKFWRNTSWHMLPGGEGNWGHNATHYHSGSEYLLIVQPAYSNVIILLKRWKFCDVLYLVAAKDIQLSGGFHWSSNISRDYTTIGPHNHVTDLVRSNSSKIGSAILTASNAAHSLRQGAVMPWDGTTMSLQSGIKVETLPLNKRCLFKCNLSYFTLFRFQPPSIFRCFYHVTALTKPVSTLTGEWGWLVAKGVSSIKGCMDLCLKVSHF